ncbi:hypothetical protein [Vibrio sp. 1291-1]|uniref:hypothetical protein n=1 Tax=Vibrio sp. 1291-1 TaxID=3074551 RepID=UPI00296B456D|nr:hypothetical protein [Vibrio sp. 1291-1]MDW3641947.1 hypothetical protein [Vibrio sp. 1291-1]
MKDICIIHGLNPLILVELGETLGRAGVNIEGLSLSTLDNSSIVHFLVADEQAAIRALKTTTLQVDSVSDVFILDKDNMQVTGKAGSFGGICKLLIENGIIIKFGYPAENNRFVFGVDNPEKITLLMRSVS